MNDTEKPEEDNEEGNESVDLTEAWTRFQSEVAQAANTPEEVAAAEELAKECARAVADGGSEATADSLLKESSKSVGTRKSKLQEIYDEKLEELEDDDEDARPRLDQLIKHQLERLVISRSTDHFTETKYQWYFSDPYTVLETSGEHRDPTQFRTQYLDSTAMNVRPPSDGIDRWYEWISKYIDREESKEDGVAEVRETVGERTRAVNDVQEMLSGKQALTDLTQAVRTNRLYIEEEDDDIVFVSNDQIDRVLSSHESVKFRTLQAEMDARDILTGPSKQTSTSEIATVTLWRVRRDWVAPVEVVEPEGDKGSDMLVVDDE